MIRNRWCGLVFLALAGSLVATPDAKAIIGVAPGGSVVRRHAIVATAAVAESSASSSQAQAQPTPAPAPAAAAPAAAAPVPPPAAAAAGGAVALGTVVTALPAGCSSQPVGQVNYYKCGTVYYQAAFQGTTLVYVSVAPPK